MPSLSERIKELRKSQSGTQIAPPPQAVDYSVPHTFNGMDVETIDPTHPPIDSVEPDAISVLNDAISVLNDKLDELIKRQKKIQAQLKKLVKAVESK